MFASDFPSTMLMTTLISLLTTLPFSHDIPDCLLLTAILIAQNHQSVCYLLYLLMFTNLLASDCSSISSWSPMICFSLLLYLVLVTTPFVSHYFLICYWSLLHLFLTTSLSATDHQSICFHYKSLLATKHHSICFSLILYLLLITTSFLSHYFSIC